MMQESVKMCVPLKFLSTLKRYSQRCERKALCMFLIHTLYMSMTETEGSEWKTRLVLDKLSTSLCTIIKYRSKPGGVTLKNERR